VPEGVAFLGKAEEVTQTGGGEGSARQTNLAFILDASGSMNADLPGSGQSRLAVAKQVMSDLIPQVPPEVHGTLWIYGHRYPQEPKETSCTDIEQVYPLGAVDADAYVQAIQAVTAIGYTPISDSLEQAARDLVPGDANSIVLVSDGEETCGGDPCALAEALKASDSEVTVHVVGYAVDKVTREQLQCIAQVSGGTYHDAEDQGGLLDALEEALAAAVAETILRVEILGPDGIEQYTPARLYKPGTDQLLSGYQTWIDNAVPPGTYDLVVHTLPWVAYPGLTIGPALQTGHRSASERLPNLDRQRGAPRNL
jgi:Ca-activated chloride channel family protein